MTALALSFLVKLFLKTNFYATITKLNVLWIAPQTLSKNFDHMMCIV